MATTGMKSFLDKVKKDNVKFISLQFVDIFGNLKSTEIGVAHLESSLDKGTWFDGSSIQGFTRIHESDMFLKPDPSTYAVIPWFTNGRKVARMFCDVYMPDGNPFPGDPRHILKQAVARARKMGFEYYTGPELEFFLFRKEDGKIMPLLHDAGNYFDFSMDKAMEIRREMVEALSAFGINVEMHHHEVAAGQHEIDFKYDLAVKTADSAITLKYVLKAIAEKYGLHATFMPKPLHGINGSGMHVHQSLFSGGKNAFFDNNDTYKLSKVAYSFIEGQLRHIKEMALITNPNYNSYKRLTPGFEAPTYVCWATKNRSALIRVPRYTVGRESSVRCEIRCPDPSSNPYLVFASLLSAGLEGIQNKFACRHPVNEDVFEFDEKKLEEMKIDTLPPTLLHSIESFSKSKFMREVLGESTFQKYLDGCKEDWNSIWLKVSELERNAYLERS